MHMPASTAVESVKRRRCRACPVGYPSSLYDNPTIGEKKAKTHCDLEELADEVQISHARLTSLCALRDYLRVPRWQI